MNAKAIIFDLDGTLLDTLQDLADSLNAMLREFGFKPHSKEAIKGFIGDGMENLVRRAAPATACIDEALVQRCLDAYTVEYEKRWNATTAPYEGVPELLEKLEKAGVPMAVLSNKLDAYSKLCIAGIVSSERTGSPKSRQA